MTTDNLKKYVIDFAILLRRIVLPSNIHKRNNCEITLHDTFVYLYCEIMLIGFANVRTITRDMLYFILSNLFVMKNKMRINLL